MGEEMNAVVSLYGQITNIVGSNGATSLHLRNGDGLFEVQVGKEISRRRVQAGDYVHIGGVMRAQGRGACIMATFCGRDIPDPGLHFKTILGISTGLKGQNGR